MPPKKKITAADVAYEEKVARAREALAKAEQTYGSEHLVVANALNNLAARLRMMNWDAPCEERRDLASETKWNEEAEQLYRRALAIDEKLYGPEDFHVAVRLSNLALILREMRRFEEAEEMCRRALAVDEKAFGLAHPSVWAKTVDFAELLTEMNRKDEAESLYRRTIAAHEKIRGTDSLGIVSIITNLAMLLEDMNRKEEAESAYRHALCIYEKSDEAKQPRFATMLTNFAGLLRGMNRMEEAESMYWRVLLLYEKSEDELAIGATLHNLSNLLSATEHFLEAEPICRRALFILEKHFGSAHPGVKAAREQLVFLEEQNSNLPSPNDNSVDRGLS